MIKKQIFVMGGGGFTSDSSLKLERYLLSLSKKQNPKICFLPQASNESRDYVLKFYQSFLEIGAQPSWLSLFGNVQEGYREMLLSQDIIYVGGGNTRSMLALWREWGIDLILREAYEKGIVLSGLSAGMLCWFQWGITDSVKPLGFVQGLGLISGTGCPHYDTEIDRAPFFEYSVNHNKVPTGYALYDHTGAHFIDGILYKAVKSRTGKKVKFVDLNKVVTIETELL